MCVGAIPPKPFQQGHSSPACISDVTALTDPTTSTRLSQLLQYVIGTNNKVINVKVTNESGQLPNVSACFQQELRCDPPLSENVTLIFKIRLTLNG